MGVIFITNATADTAPFSFFSLGAGGLLLLQEGHEDVFSSLVTNSVKIQSHYFSCKGFLCLFERLLGKMLLKQVMWMCFEHDQVHRAPKSNPVYKIYYIL